MKRIALNLAFTLALLSTAGSLFMSEILGWTPCVLCWYQRTMWYPLVIVFAVAIIKGVSNLEYIVWPITIVGGLIAFYHNLLQYHIISEPLAPCSAGVSCITLYHIWFNFLTVPLLSFLGFVMVGACMIIYRKAKT